jgi:hypothetical protein
VRLARSRHGFVDLQHLGKGRLEVAAVVAVYCVFLIVGLYAQTVSTFDGVTLELVGPSDGMQFQSSPVELAAIVTNQKGPLSNVSTTITILSLTTGEGDELAVATNEDGIAKALFPAQSGNYTWYVATKMQGYPTIVSRPRYFSTRLALIVDCLNPCSSKIPLLVHGEYLGLQVMVTDMRGNPIESANVTFYLNSAVVYSELTNPRGLATAYWSEMPPGNYNWFATASKDGQVGSSRLSTIVVA